jgi:hypothetical protein
METIPQPVFLRPAALFQLFAVRVDQLSGLRGAVGRHADTRCFQSQGIERGGGVSARIARIYLCSQEY